MWLDDRAYPFLTRALSWALALLQLCQLFLLPLFLLPHSPAWGLALLLPLCLTMSWWALQHEAIHGALAADRGANRFWGRVHAILFGASFDLLRWGHLLHHALSRTPRERGEVYDAAVEAPRPFAVAYYFRLLGGLYVYEVVASLLFLLPRSWIVSLAGRIAHDRNPVATLVDKMLAPGTLGAARVDALAILLVYGLAFLAYGDHAWMLVLALVGRGLMISLADNVWHYGTRLDDTRYARNLRLPVWGRRLVLNFNLHGVHHLRADLPWWKLASYHAASEAGYQGELMPALLAQLRGPIPVDRLR